MTEQQRDKLQDIADQIYSIAEDVNHFNVDEDFYYYYNRLFDLAVEIEILAGSNADD